MKNRYKRLIKSELLVILIAIGVGSVFVIPKYIIWQDQRQQVKAQFNIVDENDMNATQKVGLEICDSFHGGMIPSMFLMPFIVTFTCGNGLIFDPKKKVM